MHDHDLDLIAEHASGFLTGANESRAADFVRTCPQCAAEFADQRQVRALLAEAPAPALSEFERASLRRSVLDSLPSPARRAGAWQRRFLAATGAAAAVLVTVVGVGVVGQLGSGDDTMTAADGGEALSETTAASDLRVPPADDDAGGGDEMFGALAADEAQEESGALDDTAALSLNLLIDAGDLASPEDLDPLLAELTALVVESSAVVSVEEAVSFGAPCAADLEDPLLAVVVGTVRGSPVQVFLTGDRAEPSVSLLSGTDCAPLTP